MPQRDEPLGKALARLADLGETAPRHIRDMLLERLEALLHDMQEEKGKPAPAPAPAPVGAPARSAPEQERVERAVPRGTAATPAPKPE